MEEADYCVPQVLRDNYSIFEEYQSVSGGELFLIHDVFFGHVVVLLAFQTYQRFEEARVVCGLRH